MFSNPTLLSAQNEETGLEDMFAIFTEKEIVVSTLKRPRTVLKLPAIMSVITSRQIKQMGFRALIDVLKIVPGFYISMDETGEREIAVRGVLDDASQKIKVVIDRHSINDVWRGGVESRFWGLQLCFCQLCPSGCRRHQDEESLT